MPSISAGLNLLVRPRSAWATLDRDSGTPAQVYFSYVLPLLMLGTLACFVGYGCFGFRDQDVQIRGIRWGLWFGLRFLLMGTLLYGAATFVIDRLAVNFSCDTAESSTALLVSGAATPMLLASAGYIYPSFFFMIVPALYSCFLLHTGLPVLKQTRPENHTAYLLTSLVLCTLLFFVVQALIEALLNGLLGSPFSKVPVKLPGSLQRTS